MVKPRKEKERLSTIKIREILARFRLEKEPWEVSEEGSKSCAIS
jgi:hypothetical protein